MVLVGLETEVGNAQPPLIEGDEAIKESCDIGQVHREIICCSMPEFLQMTDGGYQAKGSLNDLAHTPGLRWTELEVAVRGSAHAESQVHQGDSLPLELFSDPAKALVMNISGIPGPGHHPSLVIQEPTQFDPDQPAMVGHPFSSYLAGTAPLSAGMEEFDAIGIHQGEEGGSPKELLTQGLVAMKQSQQASTLRQPRKPGAEVSGYPAIKGSVGCALQGKEECQGHYFTGIEGSLGMFAMSLQAIIYQAKQSYDKLLGSHGGPPSTGCDYYQYEAPHDFFNWV